MSIEQWYDKQANDYAEMFHYEDEKEMLCQCPECLEVFKDEEIYEDGKCFECEKELVYL